jgi:hypothetical protein
VTVNVSPSWSVAHCGPFGVSTVAEPDALVVSVWPGENVTATTLCAGAVLAPAGAAAATTPAATAAAAAAARMILLMSGGILSVSPRPRAGGDCPITSVVASVR